MIPHPGWTPWAWYADTWPDNTPNGNIPRKPARSVTWVKDEYNPNCGAVRPLCTRGRISREEWMKQKGAGGE